MIKIENYEVMGWEHAIRGMRNPMNSWEKSDSGYCHRDFMMDCNTCISGPEQTCAPAKAGYFNVGSNDHKLMMRLAANGSVHAKYRRMITVYVDITAPLYWWKEFDTYKVGTVANSCSTMHKIAEKEFELDDFSHEHLQGPSIGILEKIIKLLNYYRGLFNETIDDDRVKKDWWWQMIQLLPSSYNQRRTVMLNYEVLSNIYQYRKNHKLDEWVEFCKWIENLPYSEIIIGENIGSGSKYMKKQVVVDAFRLGFEILPKWFIDGMNDGIITLYNDPPSADIETLEGRHHASFGDYIIRGVKGEIYPCKPDIFAMTYDKES